MEVSHTHAGAYRGRGLSREELRGSRAQGRQHERGDTLGQHGFSVLKNVTADYTLTISTTIRSTIGKRCFFVDLTVILCVISAPTKKECQDSKGGKGRQCGLWRSNYTNTLACAITCTTSTYQPKTITGLGRTRWRACTIRESGYHRTTRVAAHLNGSAGLHHGL
jgi:hypothetical protein